MAQQNPDEELLLLLGDDIRPPQYDYKYFTGSQTAIYIGEVFVEEVHNFAFAARHPVRPVYSYNSVNFDLILRENNIVVGSFAINYIVDNYLYIVINEHRRGKLPLDRGAQRIQDFKNRIDAIMPDSTGIDMVKTLTIITEKYKELIKRERGNINDDDLGKLQQGYTSILKEKYWSKGSGDGIQTDINGNFRRTNGDEEGGQMTSSLQIPFNFTIVYGDMNPVSDKANDDSVIQARSVSSNAQLNIMKNVIITSVQKQLDQSGRPIQEVYQFIARNAF